ncbi:hypothetical protein [uncultured Sphingomonas sp.]|uniref:hypothetical protein n=1 Tax=uncultured Sphingomonas sp. TaxID=158754 RepID=UPI0035CB6302
MPFTLIKGRFHVRGYSPDGDSIRFEPLDPALLRRLGGPRPRINARGHLQLRIEAIDTLETHYSPPSGGGVYEQPRRWADAASDRLLAFAGVTDVRWDGGRRTVLAAADATPGYILSRSVEKNGRPVAFVFAGDPPEEDGASVTLQPDRLHDSFNHLALREGLAYPTFYTGLFGALRDALTEAVIEARQAGRGLWPDDRGTAGFDPTDLAVITEEAVILPKLFRRLCDYMVATGSARDFKRKLDQGREPVLDLRLRNFTHFDSFVEQAEGRTAIRLTREAEELVFDEMPQRSPAYFSVMLASDDPTFRASPPIRPAP